MSQDWAFSLSFPLFTYIFASSFSPFFPCCYFLLSLSLSPSLPPSLSPSLSNRPVTSCRGVSWGNWCLRPWCVSWRTTAPRNSAKPSWESLTILRPSGTAKWGALSLSLSLSLPPSLPLSPLSLHYLTWLSVARRMMIEKIAAHIADFTPRLQSNTKATYQVSHDCHTLYNSTTYYYTSFMLSWHIWITLDRNEVWARDLHHFTALVEAAKSLAPSNVPVKGHGKSSIPETSAKV